MGKSVSAGVCLMLLLPLLAAGCAREESSRQPAAAIAPTAGGTSVVGTITDMDTWNEYTSKQSFANYVLRRIYLRLAGEGGPGAGLESHAPLLAESWNIADDGLSITFRLRDAAWSDGEPVTAADVRFTWLAQTSPEVAWVNADVKERIREVQVIDPRTVTFHFDRRYPYQFTDAVDGGILPQHVFGRIPFAQWATHDWSAYSVGSGPFLLERHRTGDEIVLRRNPGYYEAERPLLDRVVIRIVPDVVNLLTQLRSGQVDFLPDVPPRDAFRIAGDSATALTVIPYDVPRYDYIGWNCERAPLDDPAFRRALTQAIDREALVEDLLFGYGALSSRPVPSSAWEAAPDVEPWPYDPGVLRDALARRGYATRSQDGTLAGGTKPLELELLTNAGNQLREDTLIKIQEQLSRVGVRASVRTLEQSALIQQARGGDFDAYMGGWTFIGKVPLATLFRSDARLPAGFNVVRYASAEVDAALERLERAEDAEAMREPLNAIQRGIHRDQPYTFLFERQGVAVAGPRLHGVRIDVPTDPLAGLERFWVEPD